MTQNNSLKCRMCSSQLNKWESGIKRGTEVPLIFHQMWLMSLMTRLIFQIKHSERTDKLQIFVKTFANNSTADLKVSTTKPSKMVQSGGFIGGLLRLLPKTGLSLMKNVLQPLAKSVFISLGSTSAASAVDARVNEKILESVTRPSDLAQWTTL